MSNHSDKSYTEQPISERALTGRRISYARTQPGEPEPSAANAVMRRPLRVPHDTQQPHPLTSSSRSGPNPSPSSAPQGLPQMPAHSHALWPNFGALDSLPASSSHATGLCHSAGLSLPVAQYPLPSLSMFAHVVLPISQTPQPSLQHVPPRHRSSASSASSVEVHAYLTDISSSEEHNTDSAERTLAGRPDRAIVRAVSNDRADISEGMGSRGGDELEYAEDDDGMLVHEDDAVHVGDEDDGSPFSGFSENVDQLDDDQYEPRSTVTDFGSTLFFRDLDDRERFAYMEDDRFQHDVVLSPRSSPEQEARSSYARTRSPPTSSITNYRRHAATPDNGDSSAADEIPVHRSPQEGPQLEQASWTPTSATISSSGTTAQQEPLAPPTIIRPSIPNLLNAEDREVPRPWGPSAITVDQHADPYATAPREAERLVDTSPTYPTATDARGQGAQTPAATVSYSIDNSSPILLGPGSQLSLRLSIHSPTPRTEPAVPSEDFTGAAEHGAPDRSSPWPSDADLRVAGPFLEFIASARATGVWSSPGTGNGRLYPDTGNVLSPGATSESATLTGGTINIDLPKVVPFATAPASVLHDSTQFGQQGQSPRPLLAHPPSPHPPSPRSRLPSPLPSSSSAPEQETPTSQPSPPSDYVGWVDLWRAKVDVVQQAVIGEFEVDETGQSNSSPAEHAATLPSTTGTAVAPLNEGSGEKGKKKGVDKKKKTPPSKARQAFVNSIKLGGPWLLNAVRTACRLTGELFPEEAMVPDDDLHAELQERSDASPEIVQDGITTSRGLEGEARDQSVDDFSHAADEEGLEFEHQGDGEQGDESRCPIPFLLYVVPRSEDETVEEALQIGQGEIHEQVQRLFFDSWNLAIATDRNNPPVVDPQGQAGPSTSAQPPARGPMDPVYPAQTRVVLFVACENAYTFTVAELGDDESPLRAPDGSEGNNKKKGAKKGGKKGGKKGNKKDGQQDQDPLEMLPRRRFNSPGDVPVNYGDWNVPTRSTVEARAMEAEGIPEELHAEPTNNSGPAQVDATAGERGIVRGRQDENLGGCSAGAGQGSEPRDERQSSQEGRRQDSEDEEEKKKKKNAKPRPPLRSRREILEEHQEWLPIRYDDRTLGQDLRVILAEVHLIIRLSYSPLDPVFGAQLLIRNLNSTAAEMATAAEMVQNAGNGAQGRVTRSKSRKRQRAEGEDEGGNNAEPSKPTKKRKTASATSSQQPPRTSSTQPPAPRGSKRRRDEATEDAAPAPKRTRRDEEVAGDADQRPSARASAATGSRPPRLILPGPSVDTYASLNESLRAAHALPVDASVSQPGASIFRQPPRYPIYHPPPEQPIAGPSRLPMAGPSRPFRKRRRGDETDDDEDDDDYVEEGGPVTWESGRRAKKPKKQ
ncbi:uncharacterized protein SCHCODRAFT_02685446 [Schizophyllum commune H4-8]|uniref:uncharacterized protein n=1 Tax=Schizophyllum commune (strain H4-8 / FGSC 9210) TaxID=578458 RepID=UPI00215E69A4|nr:uncharacterized protein SCHCODRAFT_02685446 [Schizophyllum commune H4-8]KAI5896477.1 hypothetical protein SCHCODRAFT_02685446 [Schizophyllum commune H4-8]